MKQLSQVCVYQLEKEKTAGKVNDQITNQINPLNKKNALLRAFLVSISITRI